MEWETSIILHTMVIKKYHGEEQAGLDPHYESSESVDLEEAWLQVSSKENRRRKLIFDGSGTSLECYRS